MMDALLRDDRLRWDLAQLAATLDQLLPDGLGQRADFQGGEELTLEGALAQLGRLRRIDQLSARWAMSVRPRRSTRSIRTRSPSSSIASRPRSCAALQQLSKPLEEAGYAERTGNRLTLTPRGARRVGQNVLDELFARLRRDDFGGHGRDAIGRRRRAR